MTRLDYEKVRAEQPELRLPAWADLDALLMQRVYSFTKEKLISRRAAAILGAYEGIPSNWRQNPIDEIGNP